MPFATTAAVKLCVRIARRVATRPRVAIMAVARPAVRRVVAPVLLCTAIVPPGLDVPPAPPIEAPPVIVTAPPYVPPYVLPPGPLLPGAPVFLPLSSTPPTVPGSPVPEPSTALLILGALGALAIFRRPM